ncbi:4-hydroxybenzoate polyprenyltransferase, mitochondrial-like isoform X2 [Mytilus californianus]|uniref:4-hydroxybenzoate polyprenyltransferase, mitochondrial-like isoform X2 n=1 Tax=Mytilus californianus TaxID=6549 RepID=UPI0022480507|nr:4-hydroxybenzoate polyprenyltransferase, mitochondrial-like isoform X2 [Mytilus californianus]
MNISKSVLLLKSIKSNSIIDVHNRINVSLPACCLCFCNQNNKAFSQSRKLSSGYHFSHKPNHRIFLQPNFFPEQTLKTSFSGIRQHNFPPDGSCFNRKDAYRKQKRNLSVTPKEILDASPKSLQPYLRLIRFDKPIGTWLLYWPCTWSIGLAAAPGHFPDLWLLTLFGAGAFFMRGAGCIVNDMWDRDFDRKVERTKLRPLASGELTYFQGLCCLGGMLSVSLGILLQLNWYSVVLGAASMVLVITYPLAKRVTFWPQAMLGVTLNWGVLIAWSAIQGSIQTPVVSLYFASVLYTMIYDSIYSHQDKYDDMLIGVKSTALKFGDKTKHWLSGFATIMIGGLTLTGVALDQTWPYYTGVSITAAHLAYQLYTVDLDNADDCAAKFRSNTGLGFVMFVSIVIGTLMKTQKNEIDQLDNEE